MRCPLQVLTGFSKMCRQQPLIWRPNQSTQEWSPKAARVSRAGLACTVVRVDLLSAHVLSEFVVDMSPATNAAAAEAAASANAAGKQPLRAEERIHKCYI